MNQNPLVQLNDLYITDDNTASGERYHMEIDGMDAFGSDADLIDEKTIYEVTYSQKITIENHIGKELTFKIKRLKFEKAEDLLEILKGSIQTLIPIELTIIDFPNITALVRPVRQNGEPVLKWEWRGRTAVRNAQFTLRVVE